MPYASLGMEVRGVVRLGYCLRSILLGTKIEDCDACHTIGPHLLIRRTWWFTVFGLPVALIRLNHALLCTNCQALTPVPFLVMRRALKAKSFPIAKSRPDFDDLPAADAHGISKPRAHEVFDPVIPNPHRGPWNTYILIWPVVAAVLLMFVIGTVGRADLSTHPNLETQYGPAHTCWQAADGSVSGCRLSTGEIVGAETDTVVICYGQDADITGPGTYLHCNP